MLDNKEYSKLALEDLLKEEKKLKKQETLSAVLIGILVGVLVYGVANKGIGFLHIFLPLLLMSGIYKNSQNHKDKLKEVQAAINTKKSRQQGV